MNRPFSETAAEHGPPRKQGPNFPGGERKTGQPSETARPSPQGDRRCGWSRILWAGMVREGPDVRCWLSCHTAWPCEGRRPAPTKSRMCFHWPVLRVHMWAKQEMMPTCGWCWHMGSLCSLKDWKPPRHLTVRGSWNVGRPHLLETPFYREHRVMYSNRQHMLLSEKVECRSVTVVFYLYKKGVTKRNTERINQKLNRFLLGREPHGAETGWETRPFQGHFGLWLLTRSLYFIFELLN